MCDTGQRKAWQVRFCDGPKAPGETVRGIADGYDAENQISAGPLTAKPEAQIPLENREYALLRFERIRAIIKDDPQKPGLLRTVWGVGQ